jgi:hypothetical protein
LAALILFLYKRSGHIVLIQILPKFGDAVHSRIFLPKRSMVRFPLQLISVAPTFKINKSGESRGLVTSYSYAFCRSAKRTFLLVVQISPTLLFTLRGGSLSDPPNFLFASLVGLKSRRFYCCCSFTSFKRSLNTFQSFLKLFYTFFGPLVYLKNFPILLKNSATIGSGSFLSTVRI